MNDSFLIIWNVKNKPKLYINIFTTSIHFLERYFSYRFFQTYFELSNELSFSNFVAQQSIDLSPFSNTLPNPYEWLEMFIL